MCRTCSARPDALSHRSATRRTGSRKSKIPSPFRSLSPDNRNDDFDQLQEWMLVMKNSKLVPAALLLFSVFANAGAATATGYPNSLTMTCAQAQDYIAKNDGAILATGSAYASFHSTYCSGQPAYVRTKDVKICYVGLYCDCETTYCAQSYFQGTD